MGETELLRETFEPRQVEEIAEPDMDSNFPFGIHVTAEFDADVKWRLVEDLELR